MDLDTGLESNSGVSTTAQSARGAGGGGGPPPAPGGSHRIMSRLNRVRDDNRPELQRRSLKILEERSTKRLLEVGNLYQLFTTLGLEPVSIIHYTWPGSSIKQPTPN